MSKSVSILKILILTLSSLLLLSGCSSFTRSGSTGLPAPAAPAAPVVNPPSLSISNGAASPSIGKVGRVPSRVTSKISGAVTLKIFSLDGVKLQESPGVSLPETVTIDGIKASKAAAQGLLVACVDDGLGTSYKTIVKLDATDLATSGLIRDEPTDETSTVVATLIESELEQASGATVQTCKELSAGTAAKLKSLSEGISDGIAVDEMAASLKVAANTAGSLVRAIVDATAAGITPSATADASAEIRRYVRTGRSRSGTSASTLVQGQLRDTRKVMRATTKLARQSRSQTGATRKTKVNSFITEIAAATPVNASSKAAGGALVADTLEIAAKATGQTTLTAAIDAVVDGAANLDTVAESTATSILPAITADVAVALEAAGVLDEFSGVVGNVVGGATNESSKAGALASLDTALKVIKSGAKKNKLLGGALAASSDDKDAVGRIMRQAADANQSLAVADRVDVASAIRAIADDADAGSDAGDIVVGITEAIADLGSGVLAGAFAGDATADALVGALINDLDGDELLVVNDSGSGVTAISDDARISGAPSVRAGDGVLFFNDSIETGSGTYAYTWTVASGAADSSGTVQNNDFVAFTAGATAGSYAITLSQTLNGAATKTASVNLTILDAATKLAPIVELSDSGLTVEPGATGSMDVDIIDPETGRTLTNTVSVGTCPDRAAVTGLSIALEAGVITVTASSAVAGGEYCGQIVSDPSDTASDGSADFGVTLETPAATQVFITGASDGTVGTAVTVTASALKETTISETLSLSILSGSTVLASSSTSLTAAGFFTVTATVPATATAGIYTASASAGEGSDSQSFSLNAAGAPGFSSIMVNGFPVFSGDALTFVTSASSFWVDVDAVASTATSFWVTASSSTASTMTSQSVNGQKMKLALGTGTYTLTLTASNGIAASQAVLSISIVQEREIEVTHVALGGTLGTAVIDASSITGASAADMTTTYMNSMYLVDAGNVANLDLNTTLGNTLWLNVYTEIPNSSIVSAGSLEVTVFMTQASSVREASLTASGVSMVASGSGWDISTASSFAFHGKREDGAVANVTVTSIASFAELFEPVTNGLKINLLKLREAMRTIITGAGETSYASTFDSLSGSGISVTVTITGDNFNFTTAGQAFNSFVISNITVN